MIDLLFFQQINDIKDQAYNIDNVRLIIGWRNEQELK